LLVVFFFSSRSRHTRSKRDWSSDVCSSDLVIVDLRPDSPTFGQWRGFHLTGENTNMLLVPKFFGHGYLVIENSIVSYKCAEVFRSEERRVGKERRCPTRWKSGRTTHRHVTN